MPEQPSGVSKDVVAGNEVPQLDRKAGPDVVIAAWS